MASPTVMRLAVWCNIPVLILLLEPEAHRSPGGVAPVIHMEKWAYMTYRAASGSNQERCAQVQQRPTLRECRCLQPLGAGAFNLLLAFQPVSWGHSLSAQPTASDWAWCRHKGSSLLASVGYLYGAGAPCWVDWIFLRARTQPGTLPIFFLLSFWPFIGITSNKLLELLTLPWVLVSQGPTATGL